MNLNIERLRRFVVVAEQEEINLSRCAKILHITQPVLTRQIQQLEEQFNGQLFFRTPSWKLTPYGEVVFKEAQHLLRQIDKFKTLPQQEDKGEIGKLVVGINTSISNGLLPDIIRVFRSKFPNVALVFEELLFEESWRRLKDNTIDLNFENFYNLADVDKSHFLTYKLLNPEPLVMVLPTNHPLANQPQVQLSDIKEENFIIPCHKRAPGLYKLIKEACLQVKFPPKVVQEAAWMTTIISLVAGEIGVALLPANVMNLQRTGVVYQNISGNLPMFQTAIVWRKDNRSKILSNFLKVVTEVSCN
nr:LysR family transcriptional regulator [Nostoc sp. ChiSLP03a]MDZ8215643.1 LysR family transcriptional regulator [Nostoc sp. ChiSLP03a]